jgi:hypothetical protein
MTKPALSLRPDTQKTLAPPASTTMLSTGAHAERVVAPAGSLRHTMPPEDAPPTANHSVPLSCTVMRNTLPEMPPYAAGVTADSVAPPSAVGAPTAKKSNPVAPLVPKSWCARAPPPASSGTKAAFCALFMPAAVVTTPAMACAAVPAVMRPMTTLLPWLPPAMMTGAPSTPVTETADRNEAPVDGDAPRTADVRVSTAPLATASRATTRLLVLACASVAPPTVASKHGTSMLRNMGVCDADPGLQELYFARLRDPATLVSAREQRKWIAAQHRAAGPHGVSKLESMASRPWGHWDVAAPPPLGTALLAVNWDAGNSARLVRVHDRLLAQPRTTCSTAEE